MTRSPQAPVDSSWLRPVSWTQSSSKPGGFGSDEGGGRSGLVSVSAMLRSIALLRTALVAKSEAARDLRRGLDGETADLLEGLLRQPEGRPRDAHGGHHSAVGAADRRGDRVEPVLELLDGVPVAGLAAGA